MNDYPFLREIRSPLSEDDLRPLDPRCKVVQFSSPLADREFVRLAGFLSDYPTMPLRIYGHYATGIDDLGFLRHFPHLKGFSSEVYETKSWDGLELLPDDLESLGLGGTRKSLSLAPISRFTSLKDLGIEGHKKGLESIAGLVNLEDLSLRSITMPDLDLLAPLRNLRSLAIRLGGTTNLDFPELPELRYLELWMIRGLTDVSAITRLHNLRYLFLQDLKNVTTIPSLKGLSKLLRVEIENLKGLNDISSVAEAPNLQEIALANMGHLKLDHFECLRNHPELRAAAIGLGSTRRNKEVSDMLGLEDVSGIKPIQQFASMD